MKKIISLIAALLLYTYSAIAASDTSGIQWQEFSSGIFQQAKATHHPVLLLAKSDSCHWCEQMQSHTFANSSIVKLINHSYTPVVIEINKNRDIFIQYKIVRLPTTIIFDTTGNVVKVVSGYIKPDKMLQILKRSKT